MSASEGPAEDARADKVELRWRRDLLSSSLQLEYKVARCAAGRGFTVTADYSYPRVVNGIEKEYSIDLLARKHWEAEELLDDEDLDEPQIARLELLLECKYRKPGIVWLFIPQVKRKAFAREPTLRTVSEFSGVLGVLRSPDIKASACYKGTEIDIASRERNRVTDDELRHGFEQLQYAIISLMRQAVVEAAGIVEYGQDISPALFFAPVLVTTAPLFVAVEHFDAIDLTQVTSIQDFAIPVSALTVDMVVGAQYSAEVKRMFASLSESVGNQLTELDKRRNAQGVRSSTDTTYAYSALRRGSGFRLRQWVARMLVCHVDYVPELLDSAQAIVEKRISRARLLRSKKHVRR